MQALVGDTGDGLTRNVSI